MRAYVKMTTDWFRIKKDIGVSKGEIPDTELKIINNGGHSDEDIEAVFEAAKTSFYDTNTVNIGQWDGLYTEGKLYFTKAVYDPEYERTFGKSSDDVIHFKVEFYAGLNKTSGDVFARDYSFNDKLGMTAERNSGGDWEVTNFGF